MFVIVNFVTIWLKKSDWQWITIQSEFWTYSSSVNSWCRLVINGIFEYSRYNFWLLTDQVLKMKVYGLTLQFTLWNILLSMLKFYFNGEYIKILVIKEYRRITFGIKKKVQKIMVTYRLGGIILPNEYNVPVFITVVLPLMYWIWTIFMIIKSFPKSTTYS